MTWNVDPDYIDVAERIRLFYGQYPDGRLTTETPSIETVDGRVFVCCIAHAHRTADDPTPSTGVAWEPVPGPTPFTKDSELMNAQTSAWGRAIVAAGIPSKKIASAEDVTARRAAPAPATDDPEEEWKKRNRRMRAILSRLEKEHPRDDEATWTDIAKQISIARWQKQSTKDLTPDEHRQLIDELEAFTVPFG